MARNTSLLLSFIFCFLLGSKVVMCLKWLLTSLFDFVLLGSESCSFQQCIDESPCLMFFWQGADDVHLERTSNILADMICPVLLETIIKGL
jgi:hypothetical protein